jgi:pimeloyl-ACP methyl ester carboxylesterase
LATAGYHAVAPDMRGYGGTDAPPERDSYTIMDLVGDMVGVVTALGEKSAAIVGHDWGATVAWHAALLRPDNVPSSRVAMSYLDMCITCNYHYDMSKMIQLRHVPDSLHRQLKARAALSGLPLSDYLIREVRKIAEQPTAEEMKERLRQREPYRGKSAPTDLLRAERDSR